MCPTLTVPWQNHFSNYPSGVLIKVNRSSLQRMSKRIEMRLCISSQCVAAVACFSFLSIVQIDVIYFIEVYEINHRINYDL